MLGRIGTLVVGVVAVAALAACGPLSRSGDRHAPGVGGVHSYSSSMGNVTLVDMDRLLPRLLGRFGYRVERGTRTPRQIVLETQWRQRSPMDDEMAQGVAAAQTRLLLRGTRRDERFYHVRFEAENLVRYEGSDEWERAPVTDMFRSYANEIATELEVSLSSGVRRY